MKRVVALAFALAACGDDDGGSGGTPDAIDADFVLTVNSRPAIRGVTTLKVTESGSGVMRTDDLPVTSLPTTIPYRLADVPVAWTVSIEALAGDLTIGGGSADIAADAVTGEVQLEPSDFVVNTSYPGDEFLTSDYEAVGLQLASDSTGRFTLAFRDDCLGNTSSCDIYARRFDASGDPQGALYVASSTKTTSAAQPAIATLPNGVSLVVWDYTDSGTNARGIACRAISDTGTLSAQQLSLVSEQVDVVSATPLANGDVALAWQISSPTYLVRGMIVHADCTEAVAPFTVSSTAPSTGTFGASRGHVSSNGSSVLYTWVTDDNLWIRPATAAGPSGEEAKILDATSTQTIEHARVVPYGAGYAVFVRWVGRVPSDPGKLEMYPLTTSGTLGAPLLISDQTLSDFSSNKAFGAAYLPADGSVVVTWHSCTSPGLCDVFGRVVTAAGTPAGEVVNLASTSAADQLNPAIAALPEGYVAAWTDSSGTAPDPAGTAVRARIFYRP